MSVFLHTSITSADVMTHSKSRTCATQCILLETTLNSLSFLSTPPAGHIEEAQLINTPVNNTEMMTSLAPAYLGPGEVIEFSLM